MNSENLNRTIEGATVQGPADDNDNSPMANEKLLSFSLSVLLFVDAIKSIFYLCVLCV